jgi:hypothetical protein
MKKIKIVLISTALVLFLVIVSGLALKSLLKTQVNDLFRMNRTLQEEGYYMGDFEFKMLGIAYYLDKGQYQKAVSKLTAFHRQLKEKKDLIKMPEFRSKEEEMDFYINLQNPVTGSFMDDSYPYCTFNEITENIIAHLDALARVTGKPVRLKYPLKYLDSINTPGNVRGYLNDLAYVGWIGSKFPQTSYVFARSALNDWNGESAMGSNNLYSFTAGYREAVLGWFYDNQDSITGFWGPRARKSGKLLKSDLTNTASVIKAFADSNGNDRYEQFPVKHKKEMFETTLTVLGEPAPGDEELSEVHEWNLKMGKGIYLLLRYLWKDGSETDKQKARSVIESYIVNRFEKYFVPAEGAFSYYPGAEHASLDGTGNNFFKEIGAFSYEKQADLWGDPVKNIKDQVRGNPGEINRRIADAAAGYPDINAFRVYCQEPDLKKLTDKVYAIVYPEKPKVIDAVQLVPGIIKWMDSQSHSIGNWTSREEIRGEYASLNIKEPLVFNHSIPDEIIKKSFQENSRMVLIGFDILQLPVYRMDFTEAR